MERKDALTAVANVAKRLVPDLAKLLAASYGGPVVGAAAAAVSEEALRRIEGFIRIRFGASGRVVAPSADAEATDDTTESIMKLEAAEVEKSELVDEVRAKIRDEISFIREEYSREFIRAEATRTMELKVVESNLQTERDRARIYNQALAKDLQLLGLVPPLLSAIIVLGFFSAVAMIAFGNVNSDSKELLYVMLGALTTSVTSVVTYWFGSSAEAARRATNYAESQSQTRSQDAERVASLRHDR